MEKPGMSREAVIATVVLMLAIGFAGGYAMARRNPALVAAPSAPVMQVTQLSDAGACVHIDGSEYICPGGSLTAAGVAAGGLFGHGNDITIGPIPVTWKGQQYSVTVSPKVDAVFFTKDAGYVLLDHYKSKPNDAAYAKKASELEAYLKKQP